MAQWSVTFDLVSPATLSGSPSYLSRVLSHQKGLASESPAVSADVQYIQEIMRRFRQLSPDGTECSCLKAVILFKPGTWLMTNITCYVKSNKPYEIMRWTYDRNTWADWRATSWNASRPGPMYSEWLCSTQASSTSHSIWSLPATIALHSQYRSVHGGKALLSRHHRWHSNWKATGRHVQYGKVWLKSCEY